MIITFLSTSIFWLALWALREYERREAFDSLNEEIETLRASDRRLREEKQELRDKEQKHLETIAGIDALFQKAQREGIFDLGGNGKLPAPAEPAGQHSVRITTRLGGASGPSL